MIRHIFVGTFKEGYLDDPYHRDDISQAAGKCLDTSSFLITQFKF